MENFKNHCNAYSLTALISFICIVINEILFSDFSLYIFDMFFIAFVTSLGFIIFHPQESNQHSTT